MDEAAIVKYICESFDGVDVSVDAGNSFFFANPHRDAAAEHKFPFATLVANDKYDSTSNLSRPGVFRLNVGVAKETFRLLFPPSAGGAEPSHDFTALDRVMPHPVYGMMFWVCVLNPSNATFESIKPLLAEAFDTAAKRYAKSPPTK